MRKRAFPNAAGRMHCFTSERHKTSYGGNSTIEDQHTEIYRLTYDVHAFSIEALGSGRTPLH